MKAARLITAFALLSGLGVASGCGREPIPRAVNIKLDPRIEKVTDGNLTVVDEKPEVPETKKKVYKSP